MSKNQAAGWYGFLKLLEFIFFGFYTAVNIKRLNFGIVSSLFLTGILFESCLAIFQYLRQGSIGGFFYFFGERAFSSQTPGIANASINGELVLRPYGTFSHPNVLAGFLIVAMTLVVSRLKHLFGCSSGRVQALSMRKIIYFGSIAIGTSALFLTMSRVAILLWLIIVGVFLSSTFFSRSIDSREKKHNDTNPRGKPRGFEKVLDLFRKILKHKFPRPKLGTMAYVLILLGAILILGLATPLGARFTQLKLTDESVAQRTELIRSSFEMIKHNPVFGVGLNNFLVELPNNYKQKGNVFYLQPVHNIYLLILSQTGIVGLTFFIWFIVKTYQEIKNQKSKIKNANKNLKNNKNYLSINPLSLTTALSTILILGLFDHYFLTLQQGQLLFSFMLGFCWSRNS